MTDDARRWRLLVIDDDAGVHREAARALGDDPDLEIAHARKSGDGIRMALEDRPDVILLDLNMPGVDGFKVCRLLKDNDATRHIPVLFLTADASMGHLERAFDCGAADYLRKPVDPIELRARLRAALHDKRRVDRLREQARVDALTGLLNRSALDDALAAATAIHARMGHPIGFILFDVDHFKRINDACGHAVGDDVLRMIGRTVRGRCRPYDTACRFGGDEFGVLFGQTEGDEARQVAQRLLAAIADGELEVGDGTVRITVSAGLATTAEFDGPLDPGDLFKAADAALYRAKAEGRNRLCVGVPS
jgi:diguanylate cyclase (GGDEF)-like protein